MAPDALTVIPGRRVEYHNEPPPPAAVPRSRTVTLDDIRRAVREEFDLAIRRRGCGLAP